MKNSKVIAILAVCCFLAIPSTEANAQVAQAVKGVIKNVTKRGGKKATKELGEAAGKKAIKEGSEGAGKKVAKEQTSVASREIAQQVFKENADKALAKNFRKLPKESLEEVAPKSIKATFSKNVAEKLGKNTAILFRDGAEHIMAKEGDNVAADFARIVGSKESVVVFEKSASNNISSAAAVKAVERKTATEQVGRRVLTVQMKRTAIYKQLQAIQAKGALTLSEKEFKELLANPNYLRAYIRAYTGDHKNFQEFFIRLAMGNKEQARAIMEIPEVYAYLKKAVRGKGGMHEWLMAKNFRDFLLNPKWGDDGAFLSLALTKLVQRTDNVIFAKGGAHGAANSTTFHNGLSRVIDSCSTKEELFIAVRKYARENLSADSYKEFCKIFADVLRSA